MIMPRRYSMAKRGKATDRTRAGIEMALVRLLASRPYDAITMAEIAAEADVAVRTVQRHFGSKDDLLASAVRYPAEALSEELSRRPPGKSAREDLRSLAASLFAIYTRYRREMWAAYTSSASVPQLMDAQRVAGRAWISAVEDVMSRWSHHLKTDPLLAKRAVIAFTSYPAWRGLAGAGGFGSPEAEELVTGLLSDFIFGSEDA